MSGLPFLWYVNATPPSIHFFFFFLQMVVFPIDKEEPTRLELPLQSTFQRIFLVESFRESLMRSKTVCSFCFWAISDWVTSATFSFSPSSFSEVQDWDTIQRITVAEPAVDDSLFPREFTIYELSERRVNLIWYLCDIYLTKDSFISYQRASARPAHHTGLQPGP